MANIETEKFKNMVDAIGPQTIAAIATAGPEMQVFKDIELHSCCSQRILLYHFYYIRYLLPSPPLSLLCVGETAAVSGSQVDTDH